MSKKDKDCNTTVYHAHDRTLKKIFSNKIMMQFLIKDFIKGKWTEEFDFNTLRRVNVKHTTNDLRDRENDIIWKIQLRNQPIYIVIMLEFQSDIDHYMALRIMTYTGLLLQDLIKQNDPFVIQDEYLPPMFPIVFYTGKTKWDAPVELTDCFNPRLSSELLAFQPRMKYLLLDIGHMELEQYTFESDDILQPLIELRRLDNYCSLKSTFHKLLLRLQDPRLDGVKKDIFKYIYSNHFDFRQGGKRTNPQKCTLWCMTGVSECSQHSIKLKWEEYKLCNEYAKSISRYKMR